MSVTAAVGELLLSFVSVFSSLAGVPLLSVC
jgi:hypothetical protein